MTLSKDGYIYETNNKFVIGQMKKYGAVEIKPSEKKTNPKNKKAGCHVSEL